MRYQRSRPKWWILYSILPLMAGLFFLEFRASISPEGHKMAQVVIVLLIFGIVWIWLGANEQALVREALEESRSLHSGKLYIVLSQDSLPLKEQIDQRIQQDIHAGQSLTHFADCLPETQDDSVNRP